MGEEKVGPATHRLHMRLITNRGTLWSITKVMMQIYYRRDDSVEDVDLSIVEFGLP